MPELPEVETVVRGLRVVLPGRAIVGVRMGKTDFIDDPAALAEHSPGNRIVSVERMGKFICFTLVPANDNKNDSVSDVSSPGNSAPEPAPEPASDIAAPLNLIVHLGMTGRLAVRHPAETVVPHTHVFFELDDGRELRYTDIRRFGRIFILPDSMMPEFRAKLGEDALGISAVEFNRRLAGRHARIKSLLLDQRVFRGVGNIYADETLWNARIHPARLAAKLSAAELTQLRHAMQRVLRAAIRLRGSSISDFVDADGNKGTYQQRHRVYGREGKPCVRCGSKIRRVIVAGRSSFFCPRCQPPPRAKRAKPKRSRGAQ